MSEQYPSISSPLASLSLTSKTPEREEEEAAAKSKEWKTFMLYLFKELPLQQPISFKPDNLSQDLQPHSVRIASSISNNILSAQLNDLFSFLNPSTSLIIDGSYLYAANSCNPSSLLTKISLHNLLEQFLYLGKDTKYIQDLWQIEYLYSDWDRDADDDYNWERHDKTYYCEAESSTEDGNPSEALYLWINKDRPYFPHPASLSEPLYRYTLVHYCPETYKRIKIG